MLRGPIGRCWVPFPYRQPPLELVFSDKQSRQGGGLRGPRAPEGREEVRRGRGSFLKESAKYADIRARGSAKPKECPPE